MTIDAELGREAAAEIRPGVFRPDWSAVTTSAAREALGGCGSVLAGLLDRWSRGSDADEDRVWQALLRLYADGGRAPRLDEIAAATALSDEQARNLLRALARRDLLGLEAGTDAIRYAYPFTETATGHRVSLNGRSLHALCAVDALGIGAMYRTDATVTSCCSFCGAPIAVATTAQGQTLQAAAPAGAVVWLDFAYQGSAAASCCAMIGFFCSDEHLRQWLDAQAERRAGMRLAMDEALEVGRALFQPILAASPADA